MAWYDNTAATRGYLSTAMQAAGNAQRAANARAEAELQRGKALGNIGAAIGAGYGDYIDRRDKAAKIRADEAYRQELLGFERAKEKSRLAKEEQDRLAGEALSNAVTSRTTKDTVTTPDVVVNQKDIDRALINNTATDKANIKKLARQENASKEYSRLLEKYSDPSAIQYTSDSGVDYTSKNVPGTQYKEYTVGGEKAYIGPESLIGKLTQGGSKADTRTPHERALFESGLQEVEPTMGRVNVPAPIIKEGGTKTITRDLSKKEWTKNAYNSIMQNDRLTGSTKMALIDDIGKQADALYGKDAKGLSVSDQIRLTELSMKNKDKQSRINDYKSLLNGMNVKPVARTEKGLKTQYDNAVKRLQTSGKDKSDKVASALDAMYKAYGEPDTFGNEDKAGIEKSMADLKSAYNISDNQLIRAINASRGTYGEGFWGVQENAFEEAVEKYIKDNYKK